MPPHRESRASFEIADGQGRIRLNQRRVEDGLDLTKRSGSASEKEKSGTFATNDPLTPVISTDILSTACTVSESAL